MNPRIEFYGPVDVYASEEDGEWVAWAHPLSTVGIGATYEDALSCLQDNVVDYLGYVAEELHNHEGEVQLLVPLKESRRHGAAKAHFYVCAVYELELAEQEKEAAITTAAKKPFEDVIRPLKEHRHLTLAPVCV